MSDGTPEGTSLFADIRPGDAGSILTELTVFEELLYFSADDGVHGAEPWKVYQGRARIVADLLPGPGGSAPRLLGFDPDADDVFFRSGGYVFFATGEDASSLWAMKTGSYCPVP